MSNNKYINTYGFDEKIEFIERKNGLKVYFLKRDNINKCYVNLKVKFGSIDQEFIIDNKKYTLNEGIAHFIEHKIFEMKDGKDASVILSELGADSNAFTTNTLTSYIFSTTENIKECLDVLMNFVYNGTFKQNTIDSEKDIISQEISMYADEPEVEMLKVLLDNMYQKNFVKNDIGGTKESIKLINKEEMEFAYKTFYNPCNFSLFISGNFNKEELLEVISKYDDRKNYVLNDNILRIYHEENGKIINKKDELELNGTIPKLALGIKIDKTKEINIKDIISLKLLIRLIFGESSDNFETLLNKKLITENYAAYLAYDNSYCHLLLESDSKKPILCIKEIINIINNIKDFKITDKDFTRIKNQLLGSFIFSLNKIEDITDRFLKYENQNMNLFEYFDIAKNIEINDLYNAMKYFNEKNLSYVLSFPKKV